MSDPSGSTTLRSTERATIWTARLLAQFVTAIVIVTEIILALGFVLLLFGANSQAGFVDWAYRNLDRVMAPFRGIFEPVQVGTAGNDVASILDVSVLFAMVVYGIVLLALRALIEWLSRQINKIDRADRDELEYWRNLERDRRYAETITHGGGSAVDPATQRPPFRDS